VGALRIGHVDASWCNAWAADNCAPELVSTARQARDVGSSDGGTAALTLTYLDATPPLSVDGDLRRPAPTRVDRDRDFAIASSS
jgi:hypothetical protein